MSEGVLADNDVATCNISFYWPDSFIPLSWTEGSSWVGGIVYYYVWPPWLLLLSCKPIWAGHNNGATNQSINQYNWNSNYYCYYWSEITLKHINISRLVSVFTQVKSLHGRSCVHCSSRLAWIARWTDSCATTKVNWSFVPLHFTACLHTCVWKFIGVFRLKRFTFAHSSLESCPSLFV